MARRVFTKLTNGAILLAVTLNAFYFEVVIAEPAILLNQDILLYTVDEAENARQDKTRSMTMLRPRTG